MVKRPGEKLGMSIKGGVKNFPGDESNDEGIFISRVNFLPCFYIVFGLFISYRPNFTTIVSHRAIS